MDQKHPHLGDVMMNALSFDALEELYFDGFGLLVDEAFWIKSESRSSRQLSSSAAR
jgi:hypothetical protein